jgi:hypothetical protein
MRQDKSSNPVEKAMGAWNGVERTTQPSALPVVDNAKELSLLAEQNGLLKEMTNLLGGINKNTISDPNAKGDDGKLVARLDSLINTLNESTPRSTQNQMTASTTPIRKMSSASGGIDFSRPAMAS